MSVFCFFHGDACVLGLTISALQPVNSNRGAGGGRVDARLRAVHDGRNQMDDDFDAHCGLLSPAQTVLVRPYSDDSDDQTLQEIKPRFIMMYEPNLEFTRRIEVRVVRSPIA